MYYNISIQRGFLICSIFQSTFLVDNLKTTYPLFDYIHMRSSKVFFLLCLFHHFKNIASSHVMLVFIKDPRFPTSVIVALFLIINIHLTCGFLKFDIIFLYWAVYFFMFNTSNICCHVYTVSDFEFLCHW